jgi:CheY-like chemotaxis protein
MLAPGRCILIADPERSVREVKTTTLRLEGYETDEAATLPEALERIESQ